MHMGYCTSQACSTNIHTRPPLSLHIRICVHAHKGLRRSTQRYITVLHIPCQPQLCAKVLPIVLALVDLLSHPLRVCMNNALYRRRWLYAARCMQSRRKIPLLHVVYAMALVQMMYMVSVMYAGETR